MTISTKIGMTITATNAKHLVKTDPKTAIKLAISLWAGLGIGLSHANTAPKIGVEYAPMTLPNAANLNTTAIAGLPAPQSVVAYVTPMPTVLIAQSTTGNNQLDVTAIDEFIDDVSPNARHYPPNFPNRTAQYNTQQIIKYLSKWLEPYATAPNASFDVLLRAAKINAMGRNMDLGSDYGVRASQYINKALKLQPNHAEANLLYGIMLAEGGGFKEGEKYLKKAAEQGLIEAEQSLAQSDLLNDNSNNALKRLQALQRLRPNNQQIAKQIAIIQNGGYYIWDIKDNDIHVKPID